jgi:hypothetical protein
MSAVCTGLTSGDAAVETRLGMRLGRTIVILVVASVACCAALAIGSHQKVDPATVPTGFFTAHSKVNNIPVAALAKAIRSRRVDTFLQHQRLEPNQAGGFHTHAGPVFISVARGSLTSVDSARGRCRRRTYIADQGFVDQGQGHVHQLVAGAAGADVYAFFLLPRNQGPEFAPAAAPRACRS